MAAFLLPVFAAMLRIRTFRGIRVGQGFNKVVVSRLGQLDCLIDSRLGGTRIRAKQHPKKKRRITPKTVLRLPPGRLFESLHHHKNVHLSEAAPQRTVL
jgi:hypothetical protein